MELDQIDETFGTTQVDRLPRLDEWMSYGYVLSDYEKTFLSHLRATYNIAGDDWNEAELKNKLISPMIVFAGFDTRKYAYFLDREPNPWGMVASASRLFFFIGPTPGQVLMAMKATTLPYIYGCFVMGKLWHFMVLEDNQYAIAPGLTCDGKNIFNIYTKLEGLKSIIDSLVG